MSDPFFLIRVLLLLAAANGAPVVARKLLGNRFGTPIDLDFKLPDGKAILGPGKTIRGLLVAVIATMLAAFVLGLSVSIGLALGATSMLGDLIASFIKRRLGLRPHAQAFGLDQIPEALLPLLVLQDRLGLSAIDIGVIVGAFTAVEVILSRLLFRLGIRERPY
ncbi:CDP-archaeol synthase (plasmid) [Bosea sp. F3-2]|uniref:CDP-archaeol synthase n=1 Tax=Bosea sp. F3-2 TaxID=2599640 RepID=UPI0011ED4CD7|nr:CDP-archaeol synthase [Bosea sp. F3-2]QEL27175.1 CDP-archaeol synthase [Bosea sp. F3-2]